MDHVLGRMSERAESGVSFGTVRITDLDFADDAGIFAGTTEILADAFETLNEEATLKLRVAWITPRSRRSVKS